MRMLGSHNSTNVQTQLESPMPWIGMYVALASLACSLAMAVDVFHGFRNKKLWFPCNYFSLNATSLTLLAVATKLPVDLTTNMWAATDRLAKISSLALMSTAMGNFMPTLGTMGDKEIVMNVTAFGILIITVIVDVCIQVVEMRSSLHHRLLFPEEILAMIFMMLLLLLLGSSAIMVLTTKRYLEAKHQEMHNVALNQEISDMGVVTADKLRGLVKKYWVMAETSSPQFVIARSVTCATSGVMCLLNALILAEAQIRMVVVHKRFSQTASSYGYSTKWILLAQTIGVIVGTIAPAYRWCTAVSFRCSSEGNRSLKNELKKIEAYWTQKLMECKGSWPASRIRHQKCRKLLYSAKGLALKFVVTAQILIVFSSKLVLVISSSLAGPFFYCFKFIKQLMMQQRVDSIPRHVDRETESGDNMVLLVKRHALRLEGEAELPDSTLRSICKEVDKVIETGERHKPKSLLQLLQKSCNFKGLAEFDSDQVPSLHFPEPPNCWSLPVVTLASIAIALPNIAKNRVNQLVSSVSEGLLCVKLIEKCLYKNGDLVNIRKVADIWLEVELFGKWQEMDLCDLSLKSRNSKETLQELANEGKRIVSEFKRDVKDCIMRNPLNWPAKIIAANSMYRINKTILVAWEEESDQTDEGLFDQLSAMIADILSACLTNLTRVITIKCHHNAIEERNKSVHQAAFLLGQTEEILEFLWQRELPSLDAEQAAYIAEWRSLIMQLENETPSDAFTSSSTEMATSETGGDHVAITMMEGSFQCIEQSCQTIPEVLVPRNHQHGE
ncbi:hypothetical protein Pfo_026485 [Paulownia fortunei]|nr:hypothetical protein Pfo_026485 [Paulownia fortunei]